MATKRKTDEQRAQDWVYMRQPAKATQTDAYLAGLRSERRAIKREQQRIVDELMSESAGIGPLTVSYTNSIRRLAKALGLKVKP